MRCNSAKGQAYMSPGRFSGKFETHQRVRQRQSLSKGRGSHLGSFS